MFAKVCCGVGIFAVVASSLALSAAAGEMTFVVQKTDLRPIQGISYSIYADGEIAAATPEKFQALVRTLHISESDSSYVFLNSPGGSVVGGLELGKAIQAARSMTYVGRKGKDNTLQLPGNCFSACVLAYLGGVYRYLDEKSQLGVHQFSFAGSADQVDGPSATAISQVIAAEIVKFIADARADRELFDLMSSTLPDAIYIIPHDELRRLRVVTDNIYDENWSFELVEGVPYLRIWQQSAFGENKLLFTCLEGRLVASALLQPPEHFMMDTIGMFIDDDLRTIPESLLIGKPRTTGKFIAAYFVVTREMAQGILAAHSIGAAMQPPNKDIFFGFSIDTAKGSEKLIKIITGCYR
jgi:hypothetical protein